MLIFGHRGAPGHPRHAENTIPSFSKAVAAGADGIEFDVRRCGDGRIVVIHDDTVDRTTNGSGPVASMTYEELRRLDAGDGGRIPLLSDVLDEFGARCILNIEIKDAGLSSDLKTLIKERRLERKVIVSAFDWLELKQFAGNDIPIALLASDPANLIATAVELRAAAIHPRRDIASGVLSAARRANLRIHVWTVNEPREVAAFRAMGVDGIFTDFPERCKIRTPAS